MVSNDQLITSIWGEQPQQRCQQMIVAVVGTKRLASFCKGARGAGQPLLWAMSELDSVVDTPPWTISSRPSGEARAWDDSLSSSDSDSESQSGPRWCVVPKSLEQDLDAAVREGASDAQRWSLSDSDDDVLDDRGRVQDVLGRADRAARVAVDSSLRRSRSRSRGGRSSSDADSNSDHGAATRPSIGSLSTEVARPPTPLGCQWWVDWLWQYCLTARKKLPPFPSLPFRVELLFGGTAGELLGYKAMGVPCEVLGVAEEKPTAQKFLQAFWGSQCRHIFAANEAFLAGSGRCLLHGGSCEVPALRPTVASGGATCRPWSPQRVKNGNTSATSVAEEHPAFLDVMVSLPAYAKARNPKILWIEETPAFMRKSVRLNGKSPLQLYSKAMVAQGYVIRAFLLNHDVWIAVERTRLFVIAVSPAGGGAKGADWILNFILEGNAQRRLTEPTAYVEIVDCAYPPGEAQLHLLQELLVHCIYCCIVLL